MYICVIDRTEEKPIYAAIRCDTWDDVVLELGGDDGRCFDEAELAKLKRDGYLYRDKREVYQIIGD